INSISSNVKNIVRTSEFRTNKLNFYAQKSTMNLTIKSENGKITWKEDLSALDFMYWSMYLSEEAQTEEQYKKLLNKQLEEAKKSSDKRNFKDVSDLLRDRGVDWFITTEIQKKNNEGKYVTIKKFENLGKEDPVEKSWQDPNMQKGNEYRVIKKAFDIKSSDDYMVIFTDEAECKADNVNIKPMKDDKSTLKDIKVEILKENIDEPSMAGTYVKKVQYEVNNGKKYIRLNLNRSDWMKNIKIIVDEKEVLPEILNVEKNNNNEENSEIRFEIKDIDSKMQVNMNVVPMNNTLVCFRIIPEKSSVDLIKEENKDNEEKPVENSTVIPTIEDLNVINPNESNNGVPENLNLIKENKDMIKEIKVKTLKENEDTPSMAGKYLTKAMYEVKNGKKYLRLHLNRSDWMKNVKAIVDGKEINPEVLSISKNNNEEKTEFRIPIKDMNSKMKLKMNVVPMGNSLVTFRVIPEGENLELASEEKVSNNKELKNGENLDLENSKEEIKSNENDSVNVKEKQQGVLPRTGSPIGTSALAYLGTLIGAIGLFIKKK
ncbi:NEAT domain-containing protein, partial [Clostridium tarantellae]